MLVTTTEEVETRWSRDSLAGWSQQLVNFTFSERCSIKNKMEIREQNIECKGKTFRVKLRPLWSHLAACVPIHRWTHHTQLQILIKVKTIP